MSAVCVRRRSLYMSPHPLTVYYGLDSFMPRRLTLEPQGGATCVRGGVRKNRPCEPRSREKKTFFTITFIIRVLC